MIDLKYIAANVDEIKENCLKRGVDVDIDHLVGLYQKNKNMQLELDGIRQEMNTIAKKGGREEGAIKKAQDLREQEKEIRLRKDDLEKEVHQLHLQVPNFTHPAVPVGDETGFTIVRQHKTEQDNLKVLKHDHVHILTKAGLLDLEAGAHVAGPGFFFLKGDLVRLEMAVVNYAMDLAEQAGFQLCTTPEMVREEILEGTGFNPRGGEKNIYNIEDMDLFLIGTAEIPLCGQFKNKLIEELPLRICGLSRCYRTERAAGKATRGIYRVHQFTKVELVCLTTPENSEVEHENLRNLEEKVFTGLEVPYRVIDIATKDLGAPAYRKYDIEAWMPGRKEFGEVTSTSNCLDYQARRLNIKYKNSDGKRELVHTLNGTAIATTRALIAVVENHYDEEEMRINIPEKLVRYFGKEYIDLTKR